MDPAAYHDARARTLWAPIGHRFDERYAPRAPWWWSNRGRQPSGYVVFQYVHHGRLIFRERGVEHEIGPGSAFLFTYDEDSAYGRPPERPDWIGAREELAMDHLVLRGAGLREHWQLLRERFGSVVSLPPRPPSVAAAHALITEALPRLMRDRRALALETHAFVMQLVADLEDAASARLPPVDRAVDELLRTPLSARGLKEIAERHGCTREHLTRVFTARVGVSPGRYLGRLRLERALLLLRETDLSLGEIATQCGAGSVHTLARWVREESGDSPLRLRRRMRALR